MKYSIIIPVYNDPVLPLCLNSLRQLTGQLDYEVIVVENGQPTLVPVPGVRYLTEPIMGSYQARNTGIAHAHGEVIVLTDSDCVVQPDWLQQIDRVLANPTIAGVMGYSAGAPSTRVAQFEQRMYEANIAQFTTEPALKRIDTRNVALRRSAFERVGTFQTRLHYGGDMEWGARAHAAGLKLVYDPKIVVVHHNIKQLNPLLRKRVRQNYGNMAIVQLHNRDFVTTYFPHLLRYQATFSNRLRYYCYRAGVTLASWLPLVPSYRYFKLVNVLAMRLGQLSFILGKTVW